MHPPTTSTSYSNYDSLMGSVAIPGDEADADFRRTHGGDCAAAEGARNTDSCATADGKPQHGGISE